MVAFSPDVFEKFLSEEDDAPVVMLNLLRFVPEGGRERHLEYLRMAEPILARFGARILFSGDGLDVLTTGPVEGWDAQADIRAIRLDKNRRAYVLLPDSYDAIPDVALRDISNCKLCSVEAATASCGHLPVSERPRFGDRSDNVLFVHALLEA